MTDEDWRNVIVSYFGAPLSEEELAQRINDPDASRIGRHFLRTCAFECPCDSVAFVGQCLVERCVRYNPDTNMEFVDRLTRTVLDMSIYMIAYKHVRILCALGAKATKASTLESLSIMLSGTNMPEACPVMSTVDALLQYDYVSPRDVYATDRCLPVYAAHAQRYEARASNCRRIAATMLTARLRARSGLLRDLTVMLARMIWRTRKLQMWE